MQRTIIITVDKIILFETFRQFITIIIFLNLHSLSIAFFFFVFIYNWKFYIISQLLRFHFNYSLLTTIVCLFCFFIYKIFTWKNPRRTTTHTHSHKSRSIPQPTTIIANITLKLVYFFFFHHFYLWDSYRQQSPAIYFSRITFILTLI